MVRVAHLYLIVSEYFGDVRQSIWPTLKVISLYVCNSVCVRHRVRLTWPAPMVQQRKNPSGSTFRFISVGCVLLGSQATTEMQMLKNCKHKIKVQEEKKHNVQLKTGASVYYNVGLTFYRFGLEFDGVLCWNIITTHSELRSQTLALCHCLLVKKFKSFKKLNYPQGKDL